MKIYNVGDLEWDNRDLNTTDLHGDDVRITITREDCVNLLWGMEENNVPEETSEVTVTWDKNEARQIYDFIREHLQVVNETPFIEGLMLNLEEVFDF